MLVYKKQEHQPSASLICNNQMYHQNDSNGTKLIQSVFTLCFGTRKKYTG